jgi:putative oxidoreductase
MLTSLNNNRYALLVGRIALVLVYFIGGLTWLINMSPPIGYIASKGFPAAALLGWLALIFKLGGATLVLLGYQTRVGALMLIAFTLVTAFGFHPFWVEGEYGTFMKELAMIGGLLVLASTGPGAISLDARRGTVDRGA